MLAKVRFAKKNFSLHIERASLALQLKRKKSTYCGLVSSKKP
jgi:hypothetical protein